MDETSQKLLENVTKNVNEIQINIPDSNVDRAHSIGPNISQHLDKTFLFRDQGST